MTTMTATTSLIIALVALTALSIGVYIGWVWNDWHKSPLRQQDRMARRDGRK